MATLSDLLVSYKKVDPPKIDANRFQEETNSRYTQMLNYISTKQNNPPEATPEETPEQTGFKAWTVDESALTRNPFESTYTSGATPGDSISTEMLENLLHAEGKNNLTAHQEKDKFGEDFVTGPYGMVYKYDENGNRVGTFAEGEQMSETDAITNAKRYYQKSYNEWKEHLRGLPDVTQEKLEALVSASGGTTASKKYWMGFVKEHWGDWPTIVNRWKTFATTAAGNGKTMPGLRLRRLFESAWFMGDKRPFSWYQKNRSQWGI